MGDGDTLRVTTGTENATIRLGCVDSPELAQDFGESSKEYLQALLPINTPVALRTVATDRYGRTVAEIFSQGRNINLSLVESGHAVAYRQYLSQCDQDAYLEAEAIARQNRLVFWSVPNPVMPWDFRRQR
ncbi:Staphylococcal nuclease family protein, putative [Synechococcus sp. PCC 7335]|nr:Staphylococcal nuclease family protein, putative [Synechococcus sp. PCC 7335]